MYSDIMYHVCNIETGKAIQSFFYENEAQNFIANWKGEERLILILEEDFDV